MNCDAHIISLLFALGTRIRFYATGSNATRNDFFRSSQKFETSIAAGIRLNTRRKRSPRHVYRHDFATVRRRFSKLRVSAKKWIETAPSRRERWRREWPSRERNVSSLAGGDVAVISRQVRARRPATTRHTARFVSAAASK